jgi:hypothetical protein
MVVLGVGLSVFGLGAGDASAQVAGPGVGGIVQGGACIPELSSIAPNVSYYAGNGAVTAQGNYAWLQCPVVNLAGLSSAMNTGIDVWVYNPMTTGTAVGPTYCYLHRVSGDTGAIMSSTSVVFRTGMTTAQGGTLAPPALTGGYYSLECDLSNGATLLGYYVNQGS